MDLGSEPPAFRHGVIQKGRIDMSKLKTLTIPGHHKVEAKRTLNEAIDEEPDTAMHVIDRGARNE